MEQDGLENIVGEMPVYAERNVVYIDNLSCLGPRNQAEKAEENCWIRYECGKFARIYLL